MNDDPLLEVRPSWWSFFWYLLFSWLLIPLLIAMWKHAAMVLFVYEDRIVLQRGVLSKNMKEIFISDVRTMDTNQTFAQRLLGIGDLKIATSGTSGYEDVLLGIPDPVGVKDFIASQRRSISAR